MILPLLAGIFAISGISAEAGSQIADLGMRSDYRLEEEALTTDRVAALDPAQINPSRQNWLLSRVTMLAGVNSKKLENGKFRVAAEGLLVTSRGYLRPEGLRFQSIEGFPCTTDPLDEHGGFFNTYDGSKSALTAAQEEWLKVLGDEKIKLSLLLQKLESSTDAGVRDLAEKTFQRWLRGVDQRWRTSSLNRVRRQEWKSYWQEAQSQKICPRKKKAQRENTQLDPIQGSPIQVTQILARAPARLWNGNFSVRVDFVLGDRSLNGRFLIDGGAPKSVVSPVWLEGQGVYPTWVSSPEILPTRVRWSQPSKEGAGMLANWAHFDFVRVSGFKIPVQEFLLMDTDFYSPPEFVGSCCDGVLGMDFLRSYPIEFQADAPSEVRIWPRENFHWGEDSTWKEFYETKSGFSSSVPTPAKGRVTLDLPHGRIWFSKDFEEQRRPNLSGLSVNYRVLRGERELLVTQIKPRSPAATLFAQGLRVGTVITQIDSKDPSDLDLWNVNRRLAGDYGDQVSLQWQTKQGVLKMAPLILNLKK